MKLTQSKTLSVNATYVAIFATLKFISIPSAKAECYLGEIRAMAYNFCPPNWVAAKGQTLPVSGSYKPLFALLGHSYGGQGKEFKLPDLQGRTSVNKGKYIEGIIAKGDYEQGKTIGSYERLLTLDQVPAHRHDIGSHSHSIDNDHHQADLMASADSPDEQSPQGHAIATFPAGAGIYAQGQPVGVNRGKSFSADSVLVEETNVIAKAETTGPYAESNYNPYRIAFRSPYLAMTYCICIQGIFPPKDKEK